MATSEVLRTRDDQQIGITIFPAIRETDKVMIIGPSARVTQEHYTALAIYMATKGITTITFDYRGTGLSAHIPETAAPFTLQQWASIDLDAVLLFAKHRFAGKEIIFLAHGISGELTGLAPASQYINRLVLVNTPLSCKKLWPLKGRLRLMFSRFFIPIRNFILAIIPGLQMVTYKGIPPGVLNEWGNWCSNNNGLFDVFPDANYRKLQIPLLAFSFTDDPYAPTRAVAALLGHFNNTVTTWYHATPADLGLTQIGHLGFFAGTHPPATLWDKLLLWIDDRLTEGYQVEEDQPASPAPVINLAAVKK